MKAKVIAPAVALFALAAGSLLADDFKREQDLSAKEGKPAPALNATSWLNTPDNKGLDLESLKGKVVVIDFWGTW